MLSSLPKVVIRSFLAILLAGGSTLPAQTPAGSNGSTSTGRFETRQDLQARADAASAAGRSSEAWLLRSRLERGDFQEGDRVIVVLEGSTVTMDTLQVRAGKLLQFPRMGELSLDGVLRAELSEMVRGHLSRYLNSPVVRATALMPIAVLGYVVRPGFQYVPADAVLRDVLMAAGGPQPTADLDKMVVRRTGEIIWQATDTRVALSDGLSLDALHLRSGDELFVPERRRRDTNTYVALITSGIAVVTLIFNLTR
ncbi:MAG TPA: SLBB domain-containing protein [Gemmatimonadaceae bacterium]|nr:SLBB domain-containing protein [Gemmatimonadaceae bacterium]